MKNTKQSRQSGLGRKVLYAVLLFWVLLSWKGGGAMASEHLSPKVKETAVEQQSSAEVTVGAYYYPWYEGERSRWRRAMRLHLVPPQKPKLGLYRSGDPEVIADHIAQSIRGGITFWAVSWWGSDDSKDYNFKEKILPHPDAEKLKYAILYETTGRFGSMRNPSYDNWIRDLEYLKKHYFTHPCYFRINGRPVVFVYLTRVYFRNLGQEALKRMRERFPEIYLVGDDVFFSAYSDEVYQSDWAEPFDAITIYDVYGQSIGPYGSTEKAIRYLADNYRQAKQAAREAGTAFIPTVAPGYNDTAVREGHPGRARYFTDKDDSKEGDVFRAMIRRAALPNLDESCGNIMMITSFNEWYEDSQIEATQGTAAGTRKDDSESGTYYTGGQKYNDYGHLYLDILRQETP